MKLFVEIDGGTVPLPECVYVLWAECGCLRGVVDVVIGPESVVTEDDAWRAFYPKQRQRGRAQKQCRVELMLRSRCVTDALPRMTGPCPHPVPLAVELRTLLREAIDGAGLPQAHVAGQVGITEKHISQLLNGGINPNLAHAQAIAKVCGRRLRVVAEEIADNKPKESDDAASQ